MAFDKNTYDQHFNAQLVKLVDAEKITKAILRELSRTTLEALHVTEDIGYVNQVVAALTPVNKKVAILFYTEFTGFREEKGIFTKKDKKAYDDKKAMCVEWLEDPNNNIWSWAEKEVDIAPKDFDIKAVTKTMERMLKKGDDAGFTQADILRAVFAAGFDTDALLAVMSEMTNDKPEAAPIEQV